MIEAWFFDIPPVTRTYVTLCFATTCACALELLSPLSLYFNARAICTRMQLWRLVTNFLYFGPFGLDFLFHMFFLVRYSRLLEEGSFRMRTADFLFMLLFGAAVMTLIAPFINIQFFGSSLTFMMVYVWGRRNDSVRMSFLGLFQFTAPYLPWVLLSFSVLIGNTYIVDTIGIAVGHIYYFLEDIYPLMPAASGRRLLKTPRLLEYLCQVALSAQQPGFDLGFRIEGDDDARAGAGLQRDDLDRAIGRGVVDGAR
ncbi:hypothetical protein KFE25_008759 [Diacronema lutheri]|uniref:Derlin n=1 Tax=Diacronema lutheri TaxID=2081491 RepID=A0A8J5XRF7_DIALT|nr:hypothetical protein KFE25_008759 [Diacronema lutheri]